MNCYNKLGFVLIPTLVAVLGAACGLPPRPPELVQMDTRIKNAGEMTQAKGGSADLVKQAEAHYAKASAAYEDGEQQRAEHHASMARVVLDTAIEMAKAKVAKQAIRDAQQREQDSVNHKQDQEVRRAKFQRRVDRMEKILALESEKAMSAREKKKLAAQLEKVKEETEAAQKEAEKKQEIDSAVAAVMSKIQTAESLEADKFDAKNMKGARYMLEQASGATEKKRFGEALGFVKQADTAVSQAITVARERYAEQAKELNLLAERKALLEAASQLGASNVKQEQKGVVLTLLDMFGPGNAEVLPDRAYLLDKIAQLAKAYPVYPIIVEGYTDSRGRDSDNLALSTSRAQAVHDYLTQEKQLELNRVRSAGYGETKPVADNSTRDGRAKNRRVEVVFLFR